MYVFFDFHKEKMKIFFELFLRTERLTGSQSNRLTGSQSNSRTVEQSKSRKGYKTERQKD